MAMNATRPARPEPPLDVAPVAGAWGTAVAVPWLMMAGWPLADGFDAVVGAVSVEEMVATGEACSLACGAATVGGTGVGALADVAAGGWVAGGGAAVGGTTVGVAGWTARSVQT